MARTLVEVLEDKKGEDILLLDIDAVSDFAEYFVIATATSDRMIQALVDAAVEAVHKKYHSPAKVEGKPQDGWMLVDFGDVVLHLFSPDRRRYYQLEELWSTGKVLLRVQ